MKVLLDTNIIIDDALERQPFWDASEQVLSLIEQRQIEGYISASTFSDLYYIIRRARGLWQEKVGTTDYSKGKKSFLQLTLYEIRAEICGDDGLQGKIKEYTKNPGSASLLNSIIGSLVAVAAVNGIPMDGA